MKKSAALLLMLAMLLSILPGAALAAPEEETDSSVSLETGVVVNPVYADILDADDLTWDDSPQIAAYANQTYTTTDSAGTYIRQQLVNHQTNVTFTYVQSTLLDDAGFARFTNELFGKALAHTGTATEGDYIRWQLGGWQAGAQITGSSGRYYYTMNLAFSYYTTVEQEAAVTEKVNKVLAGLNLTDKDDYHKIKAIYRYICDNVTYDNDHMIKAEDGSMKADVSYPLQFTAYGALIDGTSVCQGYANLFYRLALEAGVDARIITGTGYNGAGSGGHAWNIVKLNGSYYNVDATWDAGRSSSYWNYFLKSEADFTGHVRDGDHTAYSFTSQYPMSATSYQAPKEGSLTATMKSWDTSVQGEALLYPGSMTEKEIRADLAKDAPTQALNVTAETQSPTATSGSYTQTFRLDGLDAGDYQLVLRKRSTDFVARITPVTVTADDDTVTLDTLSVNRRGDASGTGRVATRDVTIARSINRNRAESLTDYEYKLACVDLDGNGRVSTREVTMLRYAVRNPGALWTGGKYDSN